MVSTGMILYVMVNGGVDTGWTFYPPFSTTYSNTNVVLAGLAIFVNGFSSILTGLNFIVTLHRLRAPGMTWTRLPLFCWSMYATSVMQVLGTPILALTMTLVALERLFHVGIFDPKVGGDPVLFQHLFWFYSHPAVYIMVLPSMAVISEAGHLLLAQTDLWVQVCCTLLDCNWRARVLGLGASPVCGGNIYILSPGFFHPELFRSGTVRHQSL